MDARPKVSIILPVYNGGRFIRSSVESCLNQTFKDWELVIVDDCSTDETPAIVAEFARQDDRIRVSRNPENLRLPRSLNRGFEMARGAYFTWTSDDNDFEPQALARLVAELEKEPHADLVYADYWQISEEGSPLPDVLNDPPDVLVYRNSIGGCFLYRREVHETLGGYDVNRFLAEDYDFWSRAHMKFVLRRIPEFLYTVRRHTDSLTSRQPARILAATADVIRRNLREMSPLSKSQRCLAYHKLALLELEMGNLGAAFREGSRAFWQAPLQLLAPAQASRLASAFVEYQILVPLTRIKRRLLGSRTEVS